MKKDLINRLIARHEFENYKRTYKTNLNIFKSSIMTNLANYRNGLITKEEFEFFINEGEKDLKYYIDSINTDAYKYIFDDSTTDYLVSQYKEDLDKILKNFNKFYKNDTSKINNKNISPDKKNPISKNRKNSQNDLLSK